MSHRRSSLPKSIFKSRAFLRRPLKRVTAPLALAMLALNQYASAANTQYNVKNGSTDLTVAATYTTGGTSGTGVGGAAATTPPSVTSDVLFDSGVAYAPAAFTLNSSQIFGSLNDLSTTAITIANTGTAADTLTLGGAGDLGDGVVGSAAADLLFVGTGATLNITGGTGATALGLVLGQSGNFDVAGTASIGSAISGAFVFTKTGAGTLTLSGADTSNGITVSNGTLALVNSASTLTLGTGTFTLGTGTTNVTVNTSGNAQTYANAISVGGSGTDTISDTQSTLTLNGLITLSNNLALSNTNSAGTTFTVGGGITGTGNVTVNGSNTGSNFTFSGATGINITGTISNISTNAAGSLLISTNLSGGVSVTENSSAGALTTLSGTNTNTGTDTVAVGVLEFAKEVSLFNQTTSGTLTATASNLIVQAGATAAFEVGNTGGFTAADITALNALGTSTGGFENGSRLGIDTTGASFTYATAITNNNGGANVIGLTKLGANTLTLTGANTYTGATTITAGTLQIGTGGSLGSGTYAASILDNGTLQYSSTAAQTLSGSIGGSGGLTKDTSPSTLTLSGVNTFTGATSVTVGTLDVANSLALQNGAVGFSGTGAITFDSSVTSNTFVFGGLTANANNSYVLQNTAGNAITLQIGNPLTNLNSATLGVFSGAGGLTLAGFSNTFTTVAANTYTGATTVTGATFNLGNVTAAGSIGTGSNALVLGGFASGGIFSYTRTGTVAQSFASTTIGAGESSVTTSTGTQTLNLGAISSTGGGTVDINPNTTSSITTTSGNVNGIIGGFATYGGKTTFAVAPATSGGAITGLANGSYTETGTALNAPANYTAQNIDVNASATPTAAITPNSIRFNTATAYTLTLTGVNTITSGGILQTATASAGGTITGGTLTGSAGGQLSVTNGSGSASLSLSSLIVDNGSTPMAVAVSGSVNGGYVNFYNINNSFSGGLYFNGGRLGFNTGGTPFGTGNVTFGNQVYTNSGGGGINVGANTITSGLLVDAQGANASNGDISSGGGTGNWTLIGTGTASFAGIIGNYSAGRVVNLTLDSGTEIIANTEIGSSALTVNGGTFQVGNGYVGAYSNGNNNVALNVGGGTFVEYGLLAGTTSQPFNSGLVVNAGGSTVTALNNSGAGTLVSFGGAGSRAVGGTVNFVLPTGTQNAINGFTTVNLNTNGILGGYATVGGTDWATNATNTSGGNIIGLSNSTINAYSTDTFGTGLNTNVTTSDAFAAGSTNSIRFNTAGASVVTQTGIGVVTSGGILVTPAVGANLTDITGGTLEGAASADLVVIQNNTGGGLEIDSIIANNTGATGLTKSGAGTLTLTGANTYTGGTFLNGGILNTATAGINGGSATTGITFNGGTLQAATGGITTGKAVVIGATGGTIDTNGNAVTLSGVVSGTPSAGAGALGGFNSTGAFAFTKNGAGTLTLSNIANTFGGGLVINNGTVADGSASGTGTFGTGYITFGNNANTPTLSLGSHSVTVAGLIGAGANGVITGTTGTPVVTLNGVSTQTFGGAISNGSATSVGLTLNLNNPTESQILTGANTYTGTTTLTSGTLQLGNGTTGNDGTVAGPIVNNTALVFNYFGTTATTPGAISGTGTVTKLGAGTATLTGANTYAGATTINAGTLVAAASTTNKALGGTTSIAINAGTLSLGTANQVNAAAPITMGTATTTGILSVATGANQGSASTVTAGGMPAGTTVQGLGALTLNNTSTLAYNGTATALVFGAFTANNNSVLNVTGYSNGTATADGTNSGSAMDDRLVFSGTAAPVADFAFNGNAAGFNVTEIPLDNGFYEVAFTAVPEPSTWVGGLLGLGALGFQLRRRMGWLSLKQRAS